MLPPLDTTQIPAEVREAGSGSRNAYTAALGFEQLLVQELARTMLETVETEESDATTSVYRQMLPEVLSEGIAASGGLGLAPELYRALNPGQIR
ncbi:MAG: rod-binding protein [Gaiellaceae bacterium]